MSRSDIREIHVSGAPGKSDLPGAPGMPNVPGMSGKSSDVASPVFAEPWQAQAFALVVHLNEQGRLDWNDWASCLSAQLKSASAVDDGSDYYEHWVNALQQWLEREALAEPGAVDALTSAWQRAAEATPHGQPIELINDPDGVFEL